MTTYGHEDIIRLQPGRREDGSLFPKRYHLGDGLYLQCTPSGRSWLFRYDHDGRPHWMGLGAADTGKSRESLADASRKAQDARERLAGGVDPLAAKKAAAATVKPVIARKTFRDAATIYVEKRKHKWRSPVHAAQVEQIFRDYVFPKLGDKPVADIVASDIKATVAKLWNDKPEVARKTVGKIGAVLKMAIAEEWRTSGNVATMEIMSAGTLGEQVHQVRHHPALSYKAVGEFVTKLEIRGDDVSCLALRWLITTGTRSSEARCPTWDEIDRGARTWSIPGHRTKNGGPHFVPLSDGALDILDRVKRRDGCPFVFVAQGREPVTETALRKLLRAYGLDKSAASLHGFRSSFRDWAAVRGVDDGVAEAALAHYTKATLGTLAGSGASIATMRAYKRTTYFEQRVEVMKQWDHFLRFG